MNPLLPLIITNPEMALTMPRCILSMTPHSANLHLGSGGCDTCRKASHG